MLVVLHAAGFSHQIKTGKLNLGKRFDRCIQLYKGILNVKNTIGGGLTIAEFRMGLTISQKLEKICLEFDQMHSIF